MNRKKIEKAYDKVKFDEKLLSKNDRTDLIQEAEFPFENTKRNMKLHQDKLKAKIYTLMDTFF